MRKTTAFLIVTVLVLFPLRAPAGMSFVESGDAWGLVEPLKGIMAHAAACGDIDGDGDLDLYVGNFCDRPPDAYLGRSGPVPNVLLINEGTRFKESGQSQLSFEARTSGAVFVDLDNDGDLDLYVSNNSKAKGLRVANKLFENVNGQFHEVCGDNDACVVMGGRSIGVLDYDGDRLLDLLVAEDKWTGRRTRLLRNCGGLRFEDVSSKVGLPEDLPGLGVITPDLNEDGRPDIFVAQANRLFLSTPDATYAPSDSTVFQYEPVNREASPCGVDFGDLNGDGRMDIVIVDHSQPARQHLYMNLGLRDGVPHFRDVTAEAGLDYRFPSWTTEKLHLKHGHVEIADFDNDGWPDILVAATYKDGDVSRPFVCRNVSRASRPRIAGKMPATLGHAGTTVPRFEVPPVEKADAYYAVGPVGDYDGDGRLDMFLASWFPQKPSKLYLGSQTRSFAFGVPLNRPALIGSSSVVASVRPGTAGAGAADQANPGPAITNVPRPVSAGSHHWLRVRVVGETINRMGIGAKVRIYAAGDSCSPRKRGVIPAQAGVGSEAKLLGFEEIGTGFGFCSGQQALAHFGLGERTSCDVEITLPHGKGVIRKRNVKADQLLLMRESAASD